MIARAARWARGRPGHSRVDLLPDPVKYLALLVIAASGLGAWWVSGGTLWAVPMIVTAGLVVGAVLWLIAPRRPLTVIEEADREADREVGR